jgi:GNAT superfamily N-acetyltransferase
MLNRIEIVRIHSLPAGFEALRAEAVRQGFGFMDRLVSDWSSGANTFSRGGECFLGAFTGDLLVGVGGLNTDPYLMRADVGRVRHLYVLGDWRHQGVGRALVGRILSEAQGVFGELRLRTDTEEAGAFYVRCGFDAESTPTASHRLRLGTRKQPDLRSGPDA